MTQSKTDSRPSHLASDELRPVTPQPDVAWFSSRRRVVGMTIWAILLGAAWLTIGMPTDPVAVFGWTWAATVAWNNVNPWRTHLRFGRDWIAIVVLLVIYNVSRGWASTTSPHATWMIHADDHLFGWLTGGASPTLWLQHHLYTPGHAHWYDLMASFAYYSHFVTVPIIAAVLWMRNITRWASFVRRWVTLTILILATYFVYPAAPPWWAGKYGYLTGSPQVGPDGMPATVLRLSSRGWDVLGLHHAGSLLSAAQVAQANPVAAMPSMHAAYTLMVAAFFLPIVRKRWWPLLLSYPLIMAFALVYSGEHYVIDIIIGWLYVALTFLLVWGGERIWASSRHTPPKS